MTTLRMNLAINVQGQHMFLTNNFVTNLRLNKKFTFQSPEKTRKEGSFLVNCVLPTKNLSSPVVSKREAKTKKVYPDEEITITKEPAESIAEKWREIHGEDDWAGMLDPMDPLLRSEIIRYGEMAQACYDAFDNDPFSKYCGSCKFKPKNFFQDLGWKENGYQVTSYLYSSNSINFPNFFKNSLHGSDAWWNPAVNWVGFVAVSNYETSARLGRRDITVAWRGTVTKLEWINDLMDFLKPVSAHKIASHDPTVKVEAGFLHMYTDKHESSRFSKYSAREQVLAEVKRLVKKYENEELSITITGHSLGSALAILSAYDIAETGVDVKGDMQVVPISVFSFSGPRVGNSRFKKRMEGLGVKVLRLFNVHDKVPTVPGMIFNEYTPWVLKQVGEMSPWCYSHVGEELPLDHKKSPFLKETKDLSCFHNLEALLHLLDGYHGTGSKFWLASGRDYALVNKDADFLKDHLLIPPHWAQVENKGLRRNEAGQWVLPDHEADLEDHFRPEDVELHLRQLGLA